MGFMDARFNPPETTPPTTGITLEIPLAKDDLVNFVPNIANTFFTIG